MSSAVLIGTVVSELRYEQIDGEQGILRFRMAVNERVFDRTSGRYLDAEPSYYTAVCRRQLAKNVNRSIKRGDPVIVSGRLRMRELDVREGQGSRRVVAELSATAVGHDLARGNAVFEPTMRRERAVNRQSETAAA